MRLKTLIKLSSILFFVACADSKTMSSAQEPKTENTTAATETNLYTGYDCSSFPNRDWVGDAEKNKAFLKMAISKLHELNIKGLYSGMDVAHSECQLSINTDKSVLDIKTDKNSSLSLDIENNYKVQGFSCNDSKIRYDLIFENPQYGTTEYLSLAFAPNTNTLTEVFFDTHTTGLYNSRFECGALKPLSF